MKPITFILINFFVSFFSDIVLNDLSRFNIKTLRSLHPYFKHIVSGEDFPKSKPHPAIFEFAASLSKAPKENCIVIEDSTNGVLAAKAAGIYCVGYNSIHSKLQDLSKADLIINHFNELDYNAVAHL
jgi:beta-phosphoglucomutase-like phosphatase (HAD superfamily)